MERAKRIELSAFTVERLLNMAFYNCGTVLWLVMVILPTGNRAGAIKLKT
jgi:hypothetical protein